MNIRKKGNKMRNLYLLSTDLTGISFVNRDLTGTNFSRHGCECADDTRHHRAERHLTIRHRIV
jgi:hypothetical protein